MSFGFPTWASPRRGQQRARQTFRYLDLDDVQPKPYGHFRADSQAIWTWAFTDLAGTRNVDTPFQIPSQIARDLPLPREKVGLVDRSILYWTG